LQEGEQPGANGILEVGLLVLSETCADGANDGNALNPDTGRGLIKAGDFLLPKGEPGKSTEFAVKFLSGQSGFVGHGRRRSIGLIGVEDKGERRGRESRQGMIKNY
jgi:hypothetical protein